MARDVQWMRALAIAAGVAAVSLAVGSGLRRPKAESSNEPLGVDPDIAPATPSAPAASVSETLDEGAASAPQRATVPVISGDTTNSTPRTGEDELSLQARIIVDRSPHDLFRFWRRLENLPIVLRFLRSVESIDDERSRWMLRGPNGSTVSWDCEIALDAPDAEISWRSLPGAPLKSRCGVRFVAVGDATELRLELAFHLAAPSADPEGLGAYRLADFFGGEPVRAVEDDLRRLRASLENGAFAGFEKGDTR